MYLTFRQGIIHAPANFLNVKSTGVDIRLPLNGFITATISDSSHDETNYTNYLITETESITDAWTGPFATGQDYWLYWDINVDSGERTFGHTTIEPVAQLSTPQNPVHGQMWYDINRNRMVEWNDVVGRWQRKIRVFACKLSNGTVPISMSINSTKPTENFEGTQVGHLSVDGDVAGSLLFDSYGKALKKSDGTFFTTEDETIAAITDSTMVKFESVLIPAKASQPIAAFTFVVFNDYGVITPATNVNTSKVPFGIITEDVMTNGMTNVITSGIVTNDLWNFEDKGWAINTPVYISGNGDITNVAQATPNRVGSVISKNGILIQQSIGEEITNHVIEAQYLRDMQDVSIAGATDGQFLTYNATLGKWVSTNGPVIPVPKTKLAELTDVNLSTNKVDGSFLRYQASSDTWHDQPLDVIEASNKVEYVVSVPGNSFKVGNLLMLDRTNQIKLAKADSSLDGGRILGMVKAVVAGNVTIVMSGKIKLTPAEWAQVTSTTITRGVSLFASVSEPGKLTTDVPTEEGEFVVPVGYGLNPNEFIISLEQPIEL